MAKQYDYVIGMDCGTTNIKAVVLRSDGAVVAEASRPSRFLNPGANMHEQDAREWVRNAFDIFRSLTSQIGQEAIGHVRGICVSSHTVSMLPVDAGIVPLRPALTVMDGRSAAEVEEVVRAVGKERYVHIVGGRPSASFLPNRILWFKKNEPELFAKTAYFMQASSLINYHLTGEVTADVDQAIRSQCMDVSTMDWSPEIGNAIGVDLKKVLPRIVQIDEVIGTVTEDAATETGLVPGIPVLGGCSDAMAAMQATGMSRLGEAGESSGTTSLVFVGSNVRSRPDVPVVSLPCTIPGMPWIFDAPITSTGAAIQWYIEKFAAEERHYAETHGLNIYDYLNELALQSTPGAHGLIFIPYLSGERAPIWNDYARGMFIGLRMDTSRADLIRSVFEGTAFALRHVVETTKKEGAKADLLRVCGGGAKSRTWNQIKASMLNIPVYVLAETSGNVPVGSALIAGHETGVFPDLMEAAKRVVKVSEVIEPNPEWAAVYDSLFPYYIEMYQHLDADLKRLQRTLHSLG